MRKIWMSMAVGCMVALGATQAWGLFARGGFDSAGNGWAMGYEGAFWAVEDTATGNGTWLKFTQQNGNNWDTQWGAGGEGGGVTPNGSEIGWSYKKTDSWTPGNLDVTTTTGKFYAIHMTGADGWNGRQYIVQELDKAPVEISSVNDNSATAGTGAVTVTVGLSGTPSSQEKVYVGYSVNGGAVARVAATGGSGATRTATIPAQASGAAVSYYVFTSAMDASLLTTNSITSSKQDGSEDIVTSQWWFCKLRADTNNEHNYEYVSGQGHTYHLGNCWHIPGQFEPWPGATMRDPLYPSAGQTVTFFVGNQFSGDGNPGDVTGWTLHYRTNSEAAWTSAAMAWENGAQTEWNKYGKVVLDGGLPSGTTEYYFELNYRDHDTTWLGAAATGTRGQTFATEAEAQAEPFTCAVSGQPGQEPGYMWHAGNAVLAGTNAVQFWVKIGYTKDGVDWADTVELRYKFENGSVPETAMKSGRTARRHSAKALTGYQTLAFTRHHEEEDTSSNGNSVWWCCTLTSDDFLDGTKYLAYEIAAKKSTENGGNGIWKKADYHTSSATELFYYTMFKPGTGTLTVNGMNADYTTSKFFIDEKETGGDTVTLNVVYEPPVTGLSAGDVQVFHNVGRRDFWNADIDGNHIPDAICPPNGDLITPTTTDAYFVAVPMTQDSGANRWRATITAERCGAYRLTARYRNPDSQEHEWVYCSANGMRDHAVVISPKKVLQQSIYELNGLTAAATAANKDGRSTFNTLIYGPSGTNRNELDEFSIQYLNRIQANCLWFQPIHPATQYDNETAGPGSPYAARDYFAVSKWFGSQTTPESAMTEFAAFVAACDAGKSPTMDHSDVGTINIMLDGVFNHTSWDAVLGVRGVELLASRGVTTYRDSSGVEHPVTASTPIGNVRPGWYANWQNYGAPADFFWSPTWHNVATAPDRGDFGKWGDTAELFYGRYAALVEHNDEDNANYLNEDDWFDFSCMTNENYYTEELWEYLGSYVEYWLEKTGNDGVNHWDATDDLGIDGLRCDFGQGLPPQFWEYCINRARSHKWNFMFMAESLDGGKVGYRSNRHFDILNESFVFAAKGAGSPGDMLSVLDEKKSAYNGGAILLNLTSHDEVMPYMDPWKTASRYALLASVKGLPMTFYGQEQGIIPVDTDAHPTQGLEEGYALQPNDRRTGFHEFELNFGKWVAHFKNWNKMTVWDDPPSKSWAGDDGTESRGMAQLYGRVNWARRSSPALQSDIQWMLPDFGHDYYSGDAWMMAKADSYGALTNGGDAVLAFVFFIKDGDGSHSGRWAHAGIPQGAADMLGLKPGESYTARNLAAADSSQVLWTKTYVELMDDGVAVEFLGDSNGHKLYDDGAMVYFLKLEKTVPAETVTAANGVEVPVSWVTNYYPELTGNTADMTSKLDADGANGYKVWASYVADLDPTDPASVVEIGGGTGADVALTNGAVTFPVNVPAGRVGQVKIRDSLADGTTWTLNQEFTSSGIYTDTNAAPSVERFYRVFLKLAPAE
ncbi:MAG: hypothetical protein IK066_05325 [Kiritimatiellae bacterium]|nr:hypothetical protein [Kiritimatiellia bacterium]